MNTIRNIEKAKITYVAKRQAGLTDLEALKAAGMEVDTAIEGKGPGTAVAAVRGAYGRMLQIEQRRKKGFAKPIERPTPIQPDLGLGKPVKPQALTAGLSVLERYTLQAETGWLPDDGTAARMMSATQYAPEMMRHNLEARGWKFEPLTGGGFKAIRPLQDEIVGKLERVSAALAGLMQQVRDLEVQYGRRA